MFIKVNLPTYMCGRRNWHFFLTLTHCSYSKCKDILQVLNLDKVPVKEHQVVNH